MITGELKNKIDGLWEIFWTGGLTNPLEIEKVNQDKWNAFIAKNTECENWHQFGKLAMIEWMKTVIDLWAQVKEKRAQDAKSAKKAEKKAQKEKK